MPNHRFGIDPKVKLRNGNVAQRKRSLFQRRTFVMGLLGDFGGFVIADVGSQRRDQHE